MECKHCNLLNKVFKDILNNREYWLFTEMFVYLHNGKDYCTLSKKLKKIDQNEPYAGMDI